MNSHQELCFAVDAVIAPQAHHPGRPTKADGLNIEKTLREYYPYHTAKYVQQLTGYNLKTIQKYFKKFTDEILNADAQAFIDRCNEEKERTILFLDELIHSRRHDIDAIQEKIKFFEEANEWQLLEKYYKLKLKLESDLTQLIIARINIVNGKTVKLKLDLSQGDKN